MKIAYFFHEHCTRHDLGPGHPESPQRLRAIDRRLRDSGLYDELVVREPAAVAVDSLKVVHPLAYIDNVAAVTPQQGLAWLDGDTALNPHSWCAALLGAGSVAQAVDGIAAGEFQRAFCAVRPPGHHAESDQAMGFCVFNNVAVGVRRALGEHGAQRIAVLDFDVHHGNGTVEIFRDTPGVLVCSSFQHPFYPHRYWNVDRANIVNCPLEAGSGGDDFRRVVERDWLPALERHRPDWLFISAGFDAHRNDPLAGLNWREEDYRWITETLDAVAREYCQDRIVSVLEGGYDLDALASSAEAHIAALARCQG